MPSSTSISTSTCSRCQKSAKLTCSGCKDPPPPSPNAGIKNTYYCSAECQASEWSSHKTVCKRLQNRRSLYRAGDVLQEIFYIFREKTYVRPITNVEKKGNTLKLYLLPFIPVMGLQNVTDLDLLQPFPSARFQGEQEKKSGLAHNGCSDALAWMHDIIKYMLKGITSDTKEVCVRNKNNKLDVIFLNSTKSDEVFHEVLQITLSNGSEEYVVDLSGAQFGYYQAITPAKEYNESRVQEEVRLANRVGYRYFGGIKDIYLAQIRKDQLGDPNRFWFAITNSFYCGASTTLKQRTLEWEVQNDLKVKKMLAFPEQEFQTKKKQLIAYIDAGLKAYLDHPDRKIPNKLAVAEALRRRREANSLGYS